VNLSGLLGLLDAVPEYRRLVESLEAQLAAGTPGGPSAQLDESGAEWPALCLPEAARPFFIAALQRRWEGPILVVASRPERSRRLYEEIGVWSQTAERVHYFPAPEALFYDRASWSADTIRERLSVLALLAGSSSNGHRDGTDAPGESDEHLGHRVVVASLWGIMTKTVPPAQFRRGTRTIRVGEVLPPRQLMGWLMRSGYERSAVVEEPGAFSQRGGIIDVFSPQDAMPVRLEYFGDEVESLRVFDPTTQVSEAAIEHCIIVPASEALPSYGRHAARILGTQVVPGMKHLSQQRRDEEVALLADGRHFKGMEYYLPYLYPRPGSLFDFLPESALIIGDDSLALQSAGLALENQATALRAELVDANELHPDAISPHFAWDDTRSAMSQLVTMSAGFSSFGGGCLLPEDTIQAASRYAGRLGEALDDLVERKESGGRVIVVSRQSQRLSAMLEERNVSAVPQSDLENLPPAGSLVLVEGSLAEGFVLPTDGHRTGEGYADVLSLYSDAEIFGWTKPHRRRAQRRRSVSPESFFSDLSKGDYVVHFEHGIGTYQGIVHKSIGGGVEREYLELEYAAGDRLYVPMQQIDRVSRYVGPDDRPPKQHRLGTAEWAQIRERARKAAEDIAQELLEVYASRELVQGHAFRPDTPWQADLEASFPYEETLDQARALREVKSDMERPRPMDRLVCGDVGYGKTEVALRAAFKAMMDGKQVAVLVPTTILAQQHYMTFQQRLDPFPVKVEMLSRFRSRKEQRAILEELSAGRVDVVIGTHRLIQKDVVFKDLGLLIIDEEQRFGVKHKELLRRMRREVDVLTMTATPIPRTLHLSLTGVRDMSTIDTPPEERLPIRTSVSEYDQGLVRKAILREMDRGGQVYFVHNRVQDIEFVAGRLREAVPEARFAVAHGQMDEDQLGRVMLEFSGGHYDVLICTTIIESGLDIPNVNTIIIDRADSFGLAQLYQLRGRVGRSVDQAYAYLFYDQHRGLSVPSQRRLEAILEASQLGAGYRVAMRDLEIRGAGEILGTRQHGHIAAVGFDLYCRLLANAMKDLKETGDQAQRAPERVASVAAEGEALGLGPAVDLPLSAYLPDTYVEDGTLRLRLYRRLARLDALDEIDAVAAEFRDRFGPLPSVVQNLVYLLRLKVLATQAGVQAIASDHNSVVLRFPRRIRAPRALAHDSSVRVMRSQLKLPRDSGWQGHLVEVLDALIAEPLAQASGK